MDEVAPRQIRIWPETGRKAIRRPLFFANAQFCRKANLRLFRPFSATPGKIKIIAGKRGCDLPIARRAASQ